MKIKTKKIHKKITAYKLCDFRLLNYSVYVLKTIYQDLTIQQFCLFS